jgi:hypothetical protein
MKRETGSQARCRGIFVSATYPIIKEQDYVIQIWLNPQL